MFHMSEDLYQGKEAAEMKASYKAADPISESIWRLWEKVARELAEDSERLNTV